MVSTRIAAPDVVGAWQPELNDHSTVRSVAAVCEDVLAPTAEASDRNGVPRSHLDALAQAGAMGVAFPAEVGGGGQSPAIVREIVERIAGACGTTWFCYAQHKTPTGLLLASDNAELRERWLELLVSGSALGSAAFAHLRRPKQSLFATEMPDGWMLDGKLDWVTSWPISDVAVIQAAAVDDAGDPRDLIVSLFVEVPKPDSSRAPGLSAGPALALAAMGGTHTWPIRCGGYRVAASAVASVETPAQWHADNARLSADANPATFGMARAAINELAVIGERTGQPAVARAALALADEVRELRARSYELADAANTLSTTGPWRSATDDAASTVSANELKDSVSADPADTVAFEERTECRAAALDLNIRAANALVAASGGGAMSLWATPQRRAREALFLLVQGQTGQLRSAILRRSARAASICT